MSEFYSSSSKSATFDKRNPLQLKQVDEDDEIDPNDQEAVLLRQDIEGSRPKQKRNAVKFDYDSDSSDDGKTRRNKIHQQEMNKTSKKDKNDEDDMFSDDNEDLNDNQIDSDTERKVNKKQAKFLDMETFEKQEEIDDIVREENISNTDDSASDVDESNVDIDYFVNPDSPDAHNSDRQKNLKNAKKIEPKMESFHLRTDLEEGNFDQDGNFIRNAADENAHQDAWLDGLSKHDIKAARQAHLYREKFEAYETDAPINSKFIPKCDVIAELVGHLQTGESPLDALQRLNSGAPKKRNRKAAIPAVNGNAAAEQIRVKAIESISECCNKLLQEFGIANIYDLSREELLREYQKETGQVFVDLKRKRSSSSLDEDQDGPSTPSTLWEFKWEGSDEIHGPYPTESMASWVEYNYFDSRVTVRPVSNPPSEFIPYDQVTFM